MVWQRQSSYCRIGDFTLLFGGKYIMSRFLIGIALILLWSGPAFAQQDAKKKAPTEKQIGELITKLGDARFKVRDEAAKKLIEIGKPALPQLRKAARNEVEVEISRRASKIIKIIEDQPPQSRRFEQTGNCLSLMDGVHYNTVPTLPACLACRGFGNANNP
ncbi:MAG TPA: hypothetical protein VKE98_10130, partial [Gemmataceae bacterium]|nr:hypothetical protein [Gemmataceae bacterium]